MFNQVYCGDYLGYKISIVKADSDFGVWYNGYIIIPKSNKYYKKNYEFISQEILVYGGFTYSSWEDNEWVIGFDTAHDIDNEFVKNESYVLSELKSAVEQIIKNNEVVDTVKTNRHKYIGGSDVPTLLGINKNKNYSQLLEEYITRTSSFQGNQFTEYGNLMEYKIRQYFNETYNFNTIPNSIIFEDKKIRCNVDGLDRNKNIIIEIKTNNGKHNNTFDYEVQMQLYMWAFGVSEAYLIQYERPKNFFNGIIYECFGTSEYFNLEFDPKKLSVKVIKRSDKLISHILETISNFWSDVEKNKKIKEI